MAFWCATGEEGMANSAWASIIKELWSGSETVILPPPLPSAENSLQDSWWQTALLQSIQSCTCIRERLEIQRLLPRHPFILSYSFPSFFYLFTIPASWHTACSGWKTANAIPPSDRSGTGNPVSHQNVSTALTYWFHNYDSKIVTFFPPILFYWPASTSLYYQVSVSWDKKN